MRLGRRVADALSPRGAVTHPDVCSTNQSVFVHDSVEIHRKRGDTHENPSPHTVLHGHSENMRLVVTVIDWRLIGGYVFFEPKLSLV